MHKTASNVRVIQRHVDNSTASNVRVIQRYIDNWYLDAVIEWWFWYWWYPDYYATKVVVTSIIYIWMQLVIFKVWIVEK